MVVAAILAASAASAGAHLVEINLLSRPDDARVSEARRMAGVAAEHAAAVEGEGSWS
jgi:hypothetical protein